MAESTLSLSLTELLIEVCTFLGYGPTAGNWTAAQSAEADRYVQAGVRQFYYPPAMEGVEAAYEWSFLKPTTTISTVASTGSQALPDTLGRVLGDFHYASTVFSRSIVVVSEARIRELLQRSTSVGRPQFAAIRQSGSTGSAGQRQDVLWWPIPDAIYVLTYRYEAYAGKLTSGLPWPLGGMRHSEVILESCLAIAEQRANDERGIHTEAFMRLLPAAIAQDRKGGARYFGSMAGQDEEPSRRRNNAGSYDVTYKGVTW